MKYYCSECGSDEIHVLAWIDLNTKEFIETFENEKDETVFCTNCESTKIPTHDPNLWKENAKSKAEEEKFESKTDR